MRTKIIVFALLISIVLSAQNIPIHTSYFRIYDFMDELATDGFFDLNSAIKPYSRAFVAEKLLEAKQHSDKMSKRQRQQLDFHLNELALEQDKLPDAKVLLLSSENSKLSLVQPAYNYRDSNFTARISPLLGMHIYHNGNGVILKRWVGAEFHATIAKKLSVFGSLRDQSFDGDLLSRPGYLNQFAGAEYKEASYGGDYSDSRGGISYANKWGSLSFLKDNVQWGDNYNGSNILSGRAPSFPMLSLQLKPTKWFELNYIHGWLVSNMVDSSYYYLENDTRIHYRPANKFMAANMITFTPVKGLKLSAGNAIVYAEKTIQAAYFIPIAFYKSIDHSLTKGLGVENQNSQVFLNISSRNIKHLHLYSSVFVDEISFKRFLPDNPEANPISIKLGAHLSNFPVKDLSATVEFTNTNILNYKHSIPLLTWASNGYNMGHYLGDNSREWHVGLNYKWRKGIDFKLSFTDAQHGREYDYVRRGVSNAINGKVTDIIKQPSIGELIWRNQTIALQGTYEIFHNAYAIFNFSYNNMQAFEPTEAVVFGERRMTTQQTLDFFAPKYLQGKNFTSMVGFGFGF